MLLVRAGSESFENLEKLNLGDDLLVTPLFKALLGPAAQLPIVTLMHHHYTTVFVAIKLPSDALLPPFLASSNLGSLASLDLAMVAFAFSFDLVIGLGEWVLGVLNDFSEALTVTYFPANIPFMH